MNNSSRVPDAWDDDYESVVNKNPKQASSSIDKAKTTVVVSRAERRAQHANANKKLWESAENPTAFHFVDVRNEVPLTSEFKPTVKVLSRKPKPMNKTNGSVNDGVQNLSINDEDDSEEEARKAQLKTLAERQEKAARDREEKQRKYAEVRERLFGSPNASIKTETNNSERTASPNVHGGGISSSNARGGNARRGVQHGQRHSRNGSSSAGASSADQSPSRPPQAIDSTKKLFDPDEPTSSDSNRRRPDSISRKSQVPVREPRGPDGSGRGGFGFASRGNKMSAS